jgi:GDP-L-fucose synthase
LTNDGHIDLTRETGTNEDRSPMTADTDAPLTPETRIYLAGHRGMVGSAISRRLQENSFTNLITRTHAELDLCDQTSVRSFFAANPVDYVVLAAAKVGGIHANNAYPAEFGCENLIVQANVIHEAWRAGVTRLLFLRSSRIYPQPVGVGK